MIVSISRRLWCLSSCQRYSSSFPFSLRYYILKNPIIWLPSSILAHNSIFYQIWHWWWNINSNISFHFRLFPRKSSDKIFQNIQKYQHIKNQFIPLISSRDTTSFRILWAEWAHPFMTTISMSLYQHAKNSLFHHLVLEI